MSSDATFIVRMDHEQATGPRLAVKDLIDLEGTITTAGSKVVEERARVARADAPLMRGARAANARIVGKTNLVELALGVSGINPWFGTPVNPLDPERIPGGSSSGSAVAVASGDADVAYGSDTGGSIRLPAACCGVVGLKTTFGRVPLEGVWPLAPSLDSVGPMGRTVADVALGMELLEPGFALEEMNHLRIGRVRLPASAAVDEAIDEALARVASVVEEVELPSWEKAWLSALSIIEYEAAQCNESLFAEIDRIDVPVAERLERGRQLAREEIEVARQIGISWRRELDALFERFDFLATPTMPDLPPLVSDAPRFRVPHLSPVNLAQLPALALPVGVAAPVPPSLQLIGPANSEERLLGAGAVIEANRFG
jgi:amidase